MASSRRSSRQRSNLVIMNTTKRLLVGPSETPGQGRFIPGENDCSQSTWNALCASKVGKQWLALGFLKDMGPGKAEGLDRGIGKLTDPEALARIEQTGDVNILKRWMAEADRETVRHMCAERIDAIVAAQGPDDDAPLED